MKYKLPKIIGAAVVVAFAAVVLAQNVHFVGTPTFQDNGQTLTATGKIAGLGNGDVEIILSVVGEGSTICLNPSGKFVPGQNKVPIEVDVAETIPGSDIKNGTVNFSLTTPAPSQPSAKEAGCPNGNWRAVLTNVDFESATITVIQGGETVLQQSFDV